MGTQSSGYSLYGGAGAFFNAPSAPSYSSQGQPGGSQPDGPPPESTPPEILSEPEKQIVAGRLYTYQIQAEDSSTGGHLTYALKLKPERMAIDPEEGLIQWEPTNENAGESKVQLAVYNNSGQMALQSFRLHVDEDLTPPGEIQNLTAGKGDQKVTLSWTACEDIDGDLEGQVLYIDKGKGYDEGIPLDKTTTKYRVRDLENGACYAFKITTRDKLGNESDGATVSAVPRKPQIVPESLQKPLDYWFYATNGMTVPTHTISIYDGMTPLWSLSTRPSEKFMTQAEISNTNWWLWNYSFLNPRWYLSSRIYNKPGFSTSDPGIPWTFTQILDPFAAIQPFLSLDVLR